MRARWAWTVLLLLTVALGLPVHTQAEPDSVSKAGAADLNALTAEEKAVLGELFTLNRSLEETRAALAELDLQGAEISRQLNETRILLQSLKARQQEREVFLGRRLRYMQEEGSLAPFFVLFNAETLSDFLDRLESVTWLMERDAALLQEMRSLKAAVAEQEQALADRQAEWAEVRADHAEREQELAAAVAEKEALLQSLQGRRAAVEAMLARVEEDWTAAAMPILDALGSSLLTVDMAAFQPDSLEVSLFPPGAVVHITEESLNQFLQGHVDLKGMAFRLEEGEINLEGEYGGVPVRVRGGFVMLQQNVLQYQPTEIQVRDFTVPERVSAEMLASGWMDIDLSTLIRPWVVKDVQALKGELVLRAGL